MICHHNCGASPYSATRARDKAFGQGPGASLDTDMLFLKTPHAADDDLVDRTDPVPGRKVHSAAQRVSDSEWGLVDPNLLKSLLRKHHITPEIRLLSRSCGVPGDEQRAISEGSHDSWRLTDADKIGVHFWDRGQTDEKRDSTPDPEGLFQTVAAPLGRRRTKAHRGGQGKLPAGYLVMPRKL